MAAVDETLGTSELGQDRYCCVRCSIISALTHLERTGFGGAARFLGTEHDGSIVLSWVGRWMSADVECWRLVRRMLGSVGEPLRRCHDCVASLAPGTGFEEAPQGSAMWDLAHAV